MPFQTLSSVVLCLAIASQLTLNCYATPKASNQASKKCQQYGHSCLGGHGKRSSSPPLMGLFATNSRIAPSSTHFAGSPYSASSSSEQLFYAAPRPSAAVSYSHTFPSSNYKLPLVYTLLSSSFPLRKQQQQQRQQTQQPSWKSLQESSSSSDLADWAEQQPAEQQFLVPVSPVNSLPTGTDPDGDLREGLNAALSGNNNFHRVSSGEAKGSSSVADWELPTPMKKAARALSRFRRSLLAGGKVGSLQHPKGQLNNHNNNKAGH